MTYSTLNVDIFDHSAHSRLLTVMLASFVCYIVISRSLILFLYFFLYVNRCLHARFNREGFLVFCPMHLKYLMIKLMKELRLGLRDKSILYSFTASHFT